MFSREYKILLNEGHLLQGCLKSGLRSLKKTNNVEKGALYVALFNYSIGLERLLKLTLLLDHYITTNGTFPTVKQIKDFGHDLNKLYQSTINLLPKYKLDIPHTCQLDDIDQRLLSLAGDFAMSGRYFNLNALTGSGKSQDPLPEWAKLLEDVRIRDVPPLMQVGNKEQNDALAEMMRDFTVYVPEIGFDGKEQSYEAFFEDYGKFTLILPFLVWRFAKILVPFKNLLFEMDSHFHSYKAVGPENIPSIWEFVSFCCEDREATLEELDENEQ